MGFLELVYNKKCFEREYMWFGKEIDWSELNKWWYCVKFYNLLLIIMCILEIGINSYVYG